MKEILDWVVFLGENAGKFLNWIGQFPVEIQILIFIVLLILFWKFLGLFSIVQTNQNNNNHRYHGKIRTWGNPRTEYEEFHKQG